MLCCLNKSKDENIKIKQLDLHYLKDEIMKARAQLTILEMQQEKIKRALRNTRNPCYNLMNNLDLVKCWLNDGEYKYITDIIYRVYHVGYPMAIH